MKKASELTIKNLHVTIEGKEILHDLNLIVKKGEVVAIMGPNGSGKTTLAHAIMGNPLYTVSQGNILWKGQSLLNLTPDERSRQGIFLSFQNPLAIPGVSVANMLRAAYNSRQTVPLNVLEFHALLDKNMASLHMDPSFKNRAMNEGFSGGEKKRTEILQLALLEPELAILDETDSGTDIDALQIISSGISTIQKATGMGIILITHYERILRYITPDMVLIMMQGKIVKKGGPTLAKEIEKKGFKDLQKEIVERHI